MKNVSFDDKKKKIPKEIDRNIQIQNFFLNIKKMITSGSWIFRSIPLFY